MTDTQRTVADLVAAFAAQDDGAALALFHPAIRHSVFTVADGASVAGEFHGIEAAAAQIKRMRGNGRITSHKVSNLTVDGPRAGVTVEMEAIAQDGRTVRSRSTQFYKVDETDGRVIEFDLYLETAQALPAA